MLSLPQKINRFHRLQLPPPLPHPCFKDLLNPVKASTRDAQEVIHLREEEVFTEAEVATAIKVIKSGKAAGEDNIRPAMLKR